MNSRYTLIGAAGLILVALALLVLRPGVFARSSASVSESDSTDYVFAPKECPIPRSFDLNTEAFAPGLDRDVVYDCSTSPKGRFVSFTSYAYESQQPFVFDTQTKKNVLKAYYPNTIYAYNDLVWLPDDSGFVITSYFDSMGADGSNAVYLWETAKPSGLTTIVRAKDTDEFRYDSLRLSSDAKSLTFVEHRHPSWSETGPAPGETSITHQYDFLPRTLVK